MKIQFVKCQKILLMSVIASVFALMVSEGVSAKVPEPDNIIYGIPSEEAVTVTLKVNGRQISSYTMGSNSSAGGYYVLRVPIDSVDPQTPDTARPGDAAGIHVNGESDPAATTIIGERGSIQLIHLLPDSDGDGRPDAEELASGTNPHNPDTDGDGLNDSDELSKGTNPALFDTDGDGYSDGFEKAALTDALDKDDIPVIYVDAGNSSGIEDGTIENPYNTINDGISAAPEKYTVLVAAGVYAESLIITKDIRLIGESPTSTVIDAGSGTDAIYLDNGTGEISGIEGFTIRNADNGINSDNGASPLIRNNIITRIASNGIICSASSTAKIVNNTIAKNLDATAIQSFSADVMIVNNIIYGNNVGIDSAMPGLRMDYNNLWDNAGGNYVGTGPGSHDVVNDPGFFHPDSGDFRLSCDSAGADGGDPVEELEGDYTGGSSLTLNEVTNVDMGDRIWITDGMNVETDIVSGSNSNTIEIQGEFLNDYLVADGSYIFTDTSDAFEEPEPGNWRIDTGAYGNRDEAGTTFPADFNIDGKVDGTDFIIFRNDWGKTGCGVSLDCAGDVNRDGRVDGLDFMEFMSTWGNICP
ncbi:hypothetical protein JY97_13815 [Alkalispirochaeta odontotermitis]|nr:hypothetical protein JY97_13815 [Alkalispirochaeta odontotermitis]CAB1069628.1 hypothetical protein D1AOALGA4SA_726 [Olavius algarvensis Delta 1 endosymbiont]